MKVEITKAPVAQTEMLIRKPVAEVFGAFIDPKRIVNLVADENPDAHKDGWQPARQSIADRAATRETHARA